MVFRWSLIIGLLVVVAMSILAWILSPKGENQTYVSANPCPTHRLTNIQYLEIYPRPLLRKLLYNVGYVHTATGPRNPIHGIKLTTMT